MTQKELLYFEDAISHEESIVKICQNAISNLQDARLVSFMENQVNDHKEMKEKLMSLLKEKVNG